MQTVQYSSSVLFLTCILYIEKYKYRHQWIENRFLIQPCPPPALTAPPPPPPLQSKQLTDILRVPVT